ncbi:MAG TPA: CopY family transcriptional regulator [Planctomycetaceae bacterium]|nr:CopY family transcriptional regulator [Planctomycetaceae bacterium]
MDLSRRERQIVEALFKLGEASVSEVQDTIDDPPSYSSVRAMLTELVRKKKVTFRQDGKRYLYKPIGSREKVALRMLKGIVANFFRGRPSDAICALLEQNANNLTLEEIEEIKQKISKAEKEKTG